MGDILVYLEFLIWVQERIVIIQCNHKTDGNLHNQPNKHIIDINNQEPNKNLLMRSICQYYWLQLGQVNSIGRAPRTNMKQKSYRKNRCKSIINLPLLSNMKLDSSRWTESCSDIYHYNIKQYYPNQTKNLEPELYKRFWRGRPKNEENLIHNLAALTDYSILSKYTNIQQKVMFSTGIVLSY